MYAVELAPARDLFELRFSHSTDVARVARTATHGAVDTLLVDVDEKLPVVPGGGPLAAMLRYAP